MVKTLFDDAVLFENPFIADDWRNKKNRIESFPLGTVPDGVTNGVPFDVYNGYRRGRDSACADLFLATRLPTGEPAGIMLVRNDDVCFGGKVWMVGGALQAYGSIEAFLANRAEAECGIYVVPEVFIGLYRTCAPDAIASTLQPCYASYVPYTEVERLRSDRNHARIEVISFKQFLTLPVAQYHWYPRRVATLALSNLPS